MSYDLTMFHLPPGVDPASAYDALMKRQEREIAGDSPRRVVDSAEWSIMRRIADALRAQRPGFSEFEPEIPVPWIELTDEELLVQFTVLEDSVQINVPYFGEQTDAIFQCVAEGIAVVRQITGYAAFDPQIDRVVKQGDLAEMIRQYRRVDNASLVKSLAFGPHPVSGKPWWKFW